MRRKHEHGASLSEETKRNIYFYHHSIEDHIASLAEQAGDKALVAPITAELVRLLEAKTLWESFRSTQLVPEMRTWRNGDRAGGWPGDTARSLEANVFGVASGNRPLKHRLSAEARERIAAAQRLRWAKAKAGKRDYSAEYWKRKARKKQDGSEDRRGSPEARAKQAKSMQKHYRDPAWRKRMLKHMAAMRARKEGKPVKRMSDETKAKLRAARLATIERKRKEQGAA